MFVPTYRQILQALGVEPEASLDPNGFLVVPNRLLRFLIAALLRLESFDEQQYLAFYDDVRKAVEAGQFASGFHHFAAEGYIEGRLHLCCKLDEYWYVQRNPDVRESIEQHRLPSAQHHFLNNGVHEWRAPNETATREIATWRAVLNLDVGISPAPAPPAKSNQPSAARAAEIRSPTTAAPETRLAARQRRAGRPGQATPKARRQG